MTDWLEAIMALRGASLYIAAGGLIALVGGLVGGLVSIYGAVKNNQEQQAMILGDERSFCQLTVYLPDSTSPPTTTAQATSTMSRCSCMRSTKTVAPIRWPDLRGLMAPRGVAWLQRLHCGLRHLDPHGLSTPARFR